jgi:hypothetical protein
MNSKSQPKKITILIDYSEEVSNFSELEEFYKKIGLNKIEYPS